MVKTSLKNEILRRWAACANEAERGHLLAEIQAARSEIRVEYLWAEPELRVAIGTLEDKLEAIMRSPITNLVGGYSIAPVHTLMVKDEGTDRSSQREAPLVGVAGYIAMLLAMRAAHKERMHRELRGSGSHACRIHDAVEARTHRAGPMDGSTGYVYPVDPLSSRCVICKAEEGVKCIMVKAADEPATTRES